MAQIQLAPPQIRDLELIRDLGSDLLNNVVSAVSQLKVAPLKPNELLPHIVEVIPNNAHAAESIMRQCVSLNGLMRQIGLSQQEIVDGIRFGVRSDSDWSEEEFTKWAEVEQPFLNLLCLDAFRVVAKAIDLAYEYANLYRKARILTDIRPLFSEDAEAIDGAVVSYTFRIRYDSVDGDHELSIAMDDADVRELRESCDRAIQKASTARSLMNDKLQVSTIITGRSDK